MHPPQAMMARSTRYGSGSTDGLRNSASVASSRERSKYATISVLAAIAPIALSMSTCALLLCIPMFERGMRVSSAQDKFALRSFNKVLIIHE